MLLLEGMLPHKLFTFSGREKVLTRYGQTLFDSLKPKLSHTQELIEQVSKAFEVQDEVAISIGGRGEFLDLLSTTLRIPNPISFYSMDNNTALDSVLNRKIDIAIIHTSVDSAELVVKPFLTSRFHLLLPKSIRAKSLKLEGDIIQNLLSTPCLLYKEKDPIFEAFCRQINLKVSDFKIGRRYTHYLGLASMVNNGLGWAIVPTHINIDRLNVQSIPLNLGSSIERKFFVSYRKENARSPWLRSIMAAL